MTVIEEIFRIEIGESELRSCEWKTLLFFGGIHLYMKHIFEKRSNSSLLFAMSCMHSRTACTKVHYKTELFKNLPL